MNIGKSDGPLQLIDLRKTTELEILENKETTDSNNISKILNEQHTIDDVHLAQNKLDDSRAKEEELNQWKERGVYEETVCWVVRSKLIDSKPSVKARLCARGFEEEQNYRTENSTCSREGTRAMFALTSSTKWSINSIDIKTAFPQG